MQGMARRPGFAVSHFTGFYSLGDSEICLVAGGALVCCRVHAESDASSLQGRDPR